MISLVGKQKLTELKKDNFKFILLYLIPTLVYAGVVVLLFVFSSREVKSVFPIILSIVSTLFFTYILFLSVIPLRNHLSYMKMCKEASIGTIFESDVIFTGFVENTMTVRGVLCVGLNIKEIDEKTDLIRYVPIEYKNLFVINHKYKIHSHHQVVIAYEEIIDEKVD